MQQVVAAVVVFTGFIMLLVVFVVAARAWLSPSGTVTITVKGHRSFPAPAGRKLVWALADNGISLPSACGGRGSCGQCRVRVLSGGGAVLPNEAALIGRRESAQGMRLACMVTVRDDVEVSVPDKHLASKSWSASVRSNTNLAPLLTELVLELPAGERLEFEAGDYVLLEAPAYRAAFRDFSIAPEFREDWQRLGLFDLTSQSSEPLTRAYSLANPPQYSDIAVLVVRIAPPPPNAEGSVPPGKVSSYIFSLAPGDLVEIRGPYGHFHAAETEREMVMIAGGAGIAPIRSIILDQLARGARRQITLWYGARDARDFCYCDEFDSLAQQHDNFAWHAVASAPRPGSDWPGNQGFVHEVVFSRFLQNHPEPEELEYYLCGPPVMSAAVLDMLDDLGVGSERIFIDDFGGQ